MKPLSLIYSILLVIMVHTGRAQQADQSKNIIYGEFLGAGDLYSINYERMLKPNQSVRLGFAYFPENWYEGGLSEKNIMNIPLSFQYIFGKSNHKVEISAALLSSFTISKNQPTQCSISPIISTGYRYQKAHRGPYIGCKVYLFLPWYLSIDKDDWLFYSGNSYLLAPGVSIGWSF